eukprot:31379-Pelagococcus_subviridis.AAC.31
MTWNSPNVIPPDPAFPSPSRNRLSRFRRSASSPIARRRPDEVLHDRLQVAQAYEPVAVDVVDLETETERVGGRTTRQATDGGGRRTDGRDEMR